MDKHYGQIVELIIRKKGYSISELARLTSVNRRSVYNWFNQKYLKPEIIYRIGCILDHDFSQEFPELFTKDDFEAPSKAVASVVNEPSSPVVWKDKYIELLERYNNLLSKKLQNES
ncbi:MAG: XRE family transcriptional regulator [Sphingobacteriaceae bacterium]|nr:MAG: XRE family transcriptional regulator [Sphingobacteriaceae bacterium]